MLVRLLHNAPYPKVLMIPPSMEAMDRLEDLPGFDAAIRWPCPADEFQQQIADLQRKTDHGSATAKVAC